MRRLYSKEELRGDKPERIACPFRSIASLELPSSTSSMAHAETSWAFLNRTLPTWFDAAKLGLFVHVGLFSVPAFAPTKYGFKDYEAGRISLKKWMTWNAYAEWYANTLQIAQSPTARHHEQTFGTADYFDFQPQFDAESKRWSMQMDGWVKEMQETGFQYIVLTTKHHDGYCLWPTTTRTPTPSHNLVKSMSESCAKYGVKFGVYYSGGFDWSWEGQLDEKTLHPPMPKQPEYAKLADQHLKELIDSVKPDILWNDIQWPHVGNGYSKLDEILKHYIDAVPHGVINDRFFHFMDPKPYPGDFSTPEYTTFPTPRKAKWETCRGIANSFGYNQQDTEKDAMGHAELISLLCDVVSKHGNLLLNVGPAADGSVSIVQQRRLNTLKRWMHVNGAWLKNATVWQGSVEGATREGTPARIWKWRNQLVVAVLGPPVEHVRIRGLDFDESRLARHGFLATSHGDKQVHVHARMESQGWELSIHIPKHYYSLLETAIDHPSHKACLAFLVRFEMSPQK